jgi:hypothetical protein
MVEAGLLVIDLIVKICKNILGMSDDDHYNE